MSKFSRREFLEQSMFATAAAVAAQHANLPVLVAQGSSGPNETINSTIVPSTPEPRRVSITRPMTVSNTIVAR